MKRMFTMLAIIGLLAACSAQGEGGTQSTAPAASTAASATASDPGSSSASGTASAACTEAFAPLAELGIEKTSELGDLPDDVQPTVEACESVDDWIAGAQAVVAAEVRPGTADLLLRMLCDDQSLTRTPICQELG